MKKQKKKKPTPPKKKNLGAMSNNAICLFRGCSRGVMVTGLRNRSKRVRTPVALLRSLSEKYPWERYEPPYPPSYRLN